MNSKISVVLNTYNAERYLPQVLDALTEFDEIVVCDMESTDATIEISKKYGCRIVTFHKGNISICEPARNTAIQSAKNDWVLVIDADEIVTQDLREYLYNRINHGNCPEALRIPRRNKFLGQYIHSSPDYQTRFLKKSKVDWPPIIHCSPKVDGIVENIPSNNENLYLLHLDNASLTERYTKLNIYSDYEVPKRIHKKHGMFSLFFRPAWFFIRSFFVQGGWKDGKRGVLRGLMASQYQIMLLSKLHEQRLKNS